MGGFASDEQVLVAGLWGVPGPGIRTIDVIASRFFGDLKAILELPFAEWVPELQLPRQAGDVVQSARDENVRTLAESAERIWRRCQDTGTRWAFKGDDAYPRLLGDIPNAPAMLFFRGPGAQGSPKRAVAMVGTRRAEGFALDTTRRFACALGRSGLVVVSGAARGIDSAAHKGAIDAHGETWAFFGECLDKLNGHNQQVHDLILTKQGTVFSELPPGVRAQWKKTLPRRNRLISGSSDLTVIARAPDGSGALLTADYAREQGRPLMAIPGEVHADTAVGGNTLLREGKARICVGVFDIFDALGLPHSALMPEPQRTFVELPDGLSAEAVCVADVLAGQPMDYDTLLAASQLTSGQLSAALTTLEIAEVVLEGAGRIYYRA